MKIVLLGLVFLAVPFFASATTHNAGTNVLNNGTIYMVTTNSQLRPYTSAGAYLSYGFNSWGNVEQANTNDLALPVGNFIPPRDGKIVCSDRGTDKGTCYLITSGKKAGFTSEDVFNKLGFDFKYALYGDISFLPAADNISSTTQTHLPGTLINDNGTVKLVGTAGTVGVPSMDTLKSWGYSLVDVVNANTADKTLPQSDILTPHTSGQLAYNTTTINNPANPTPAITPTPTPTSTSALTDVCNNIEGVQTNIPAGMYQDGSGKCFANIILAPQNTSQPTNPTPAPSPIPTTAPTPNPSPSPTPTPTPIPGDISPPSVPTGLTSSSGLNYITLSWNSSTDPDSPVVGYKIFRNGAQIANVTAGTSYSDTNVVAGTTYTYTISAYDSSNNISAQSSQYFGTASPLNLLPPYTEDQLLQLALKACGNDPWCPNHFSYFTIGSVNKLTDTTASFGYGTYVGYYDFYKNMRVVFQGQVVTGMHPVQGLPDQSFFNTVSGLTPNTNYTYQVIYSEIGRQDTVITKTFTTLPPQPVAPKVVISAVGSITSPVSATVNPTGAPSSAENMGIFAVTNNGTGNIIINSITLLQGGTAPTTAPVAYIVYDPSNGLSSGISSVTYLTGNTPTVVALNQNSAASAGGVTIPAGTTKYLVVQANTNDFNNGNSGTTKSYSLTLTTWAWSDGVTTFTPSGYQFAVTAVTTTGASRSY